MPPKENEVELSELIALEEQIEDLKGALYDAKVLLKSAIIIPKGATNGDMIMTMFPSSEVREIMDDLVHYTLDGYVGAYIPKDWWNTPYKKEVKKNDKRRN